MVRGAPRKMGYRANLHEFYTRIIDSSLRHGHILYCVHGRKSGYVWFEFISHVLDSSAGATAGRNGNLGFYGAEVGEARADRRA